MIKIFFFESARGRKIQNYMKNKTIQELTNIENEYSKSLLLATDKTKLIVLINKVRELIDFIKINT